MTILIRQVCLSLKSSAPRLSKASSLLAVKSCDTMPTPLSLSDWSMQVPSLVGANVETWDEPAWARPGARVAPAPEAKAAVMTRAETPTPATIDAREQILDIPMVLMMNLPEVVACAHRQ